MLISSPRKLLLAPVRVLRAAAATATAVALAGVLAGCGSDGDGGGGKDASAQSAAETLQASISDIDHLVPLDEDTDVNGLLGRPNGYVAATVIFDSRVECLVPDEPGVDCGATVEQWPSESAAQNRADYIAEIQEAAPLLGSEWHHIRGGLLLRVSGDLKPSEAEVYEEIFVGEDLVSGGSAGGDAESAAAGTAEGTEPFAFEDIDTDAWTADLVAAGDVRADPNLADLYDLSMDDCSKEAEGLELGLTLTGARPDLMRINME